MLKRLNAIVSGRVRGVMYRDFTQRNATNLGLSGTVRNLRDGTVEVVAEGEEEQLKSLLERLKKGSPFSKVSDIKAEWLEPSNEFSGFKILFENFWDRF